MKIFNPSIELGQLSGSILLDSTAKSTIAYQLTASFDPRYVLSGSVGAADWNTLLNRPDGLVSGSSQITLAGDVSGTGNAVNITSNCIVNADINASAGIVYTKLDFNGSGLVSGSSQVSYPSISNIPSGIVSGSSQISYTGITNVPAGLVSGSSQVDVTQTTNYSSVVNTSTNQTVGGVKTFSACIVGSTSIISPTVFGSTVVCGGSVCSSGNMRGSVVCASSCFVGNLCGTATSATSVVIAALSGGSNNRIVRYNYSDFSWTNAGNTDDVEFLKGLVARGNDGNFYGGGSFVPWSGISAGSYYYLSTSGNITTSAPTPNGSTKRVPIGLAVTSTTLYFYPLEPIS